MKKFLNNLKAEASSIRMSTAEKAAMRANIFGAASPVQTAPSPYFFFSYQFRMGVAGLLVFVLAGAGTASAAQGSLPGDILYPIKVNITEPVEVALAQTPAAKAEVQATLATRRVEEAQTLASEGRLDKKTAETLSIDFDEHSAQALALAEPDEQVVEPTQVSVQAKVQVREQENSAPRAASMMIQVAAEATTSPEQWGQSDKKSDRHRGSLRESLRANADILKELRAHASSTKDDKDGRDWSSEVSKEGEDN